MRITITGKAFIGFILMASALSIIIIFMYGAIHSVNEAVSHVGEPNKQLQTWKSVIGKLNAAEGSVNKWKISNDKNDLLNFDSCRIAANAGLKLLAESEKTNQKENALTDSLKILSGERFDLLGQWIVSADSFSAVPTVVDDILHQMQKKESQSKNNSAKDSLKIDTVEIASEGNFWHRLFNNNKEITKVDTIVVAPQKKPALITTASLRATIASAQQREASMNEKHLIVEMTLLKNENNIVSRLNENTAQFENIIAEQTTSKIRSATDAAAEGTTSVTVGMFATAVSLMCLFIYFIKRDVDRNKKLNILLEKAKQNAEQLAKAKEEFLANMSHEIRTPLNIISGFSFQLLKSPLNGKQRLQTEGVHRSSEHLIALVNDILDYSKMQSGKFELEKIGFRLKDLELDLQAAFGTAAKEKGLDFNISIAQGIPEILVGDPIRIRQVLFNIVSNALKFTELGKINISFSRAIGINENTENICISISDTGIGIGRDKLDSIFDAFTQAESSIARNYGGTGLGLSITKFLVEQMQGSISVESSRGKGTTFNVLLPLSKGNKSNLPADLSKISSSDFLNGKIILVCDDEPINRIIAAQVLESYGAIVFEANSGIESISILREQNVDLILIDLHMPEMSGNETVKAIRNSTNKAISSVNVIALTGKTNPAEKEQCSKDGMQGYIIKPYKEEQFIKEISRVMNLSDN